MREAPVRRADLEFARALRLLAGERPLHFNVSGQCMAPTLRHGSSVEISPAKRYWPGDIVAFSTPTGELRLHRVLGYWLAGWSMRLVTRPDSAGTRDPLIVPAEILGRVTAMEGRARPARVTWRDRLKASSRFVRLALRGLIG